MDAREFVAFFGWTALSNNARNWINFPLDTQPFAHAKVIVTDSGKELPVTNVTIDGDHNIRIYI